MTVPPTYLWVPLSKSTTRISLAVICSRLTLLASGLGIPVARLRVTNLRYLLAYGFTGYRSPVLASLYSPYRTENPSVLLIIRGYRLSHGRFLPSRKFSLVNAVQKFLVRSW